MAKNTSLNAASIAKQDEFYTQYKDIQDELLSALRLQEANKSIEDVLQQAFGGEDGSVRFEKYCKAEKIDYRFFSF